MKLFLFNYDNYGELFSDEFIEAYPQFRGLEDDDIGRDDVDIIKALEAFGLKTMPWIRLVEIPDDVTDWDINASFDGREWVVCVHNGKLRYR